MNYQHHTETNLSIDWKPSKSLKLPVYKQIINYISHKVACGDWPIGMQLPAQRKLALLWSVNRSTIVTAINELISYGILETSYGSGTKVASNTWSVLMSNKQIDWSHYMSEGSFRANMPTIQTINRLEFSKGYIRLGTGELSPDFFPSHLMKTAFSHLEKHLFSLNYLEPLGLLELREALSIHLKKQGINAPASSILITSGSLHALQLISVGILKTGSTICTEAPTYLKSLRLFESAGMHLSGVAMDSEGIMPWMIKNPSASSLLYTIPTYHNPTGTLMSHSRRTQLFEFCKQHQLPIIEDNAYGELWLDNLPPQALKAKDRNGMVLYLGTISKTLAPGLRIGWLVGPESVVWRLGDIKMQMDYGASSVSQWLLYELLKSGLYDTYLNDMRKKLKKRRDAALAALDKYFSHLGTWNTPSGGFYIWLKLNKAVPTDKLFKAALEKNIILNPGSIYDFNKNYCLRISYAYEDCTAFAKGIQILAELLESF